MNILANCWYWKRVQLQPKYTLDVMGLITKTHSVCKDKIMYTLFIIVNGIYIEIRDVVYPWTSNAMTCSILCIPEILLLPFSSNLRNEKFIDELDLVRKPCRPWGANKSLEFILQRPIPTSLMTHQLSASFLNVVILWVGGSVIHMLIWQ